jgi:hypothetical protein
LKSTYVPSDAAGLFRTWCKPWWIAGGWAIDLFLGRVTRAHEDLDVAVLRRDQLALRAFLPAWDMHIGWGDGVTDPTPWSGTGPIDPSAPAIWCRAEASAEWAFEALLTDAVAEDCVFRDGLVKMPLSAIGRVSGDGISYLRPEIVLLFKAKHNGSKDQEDLANTITHLSIEDRAWLRQSLEMVHPGHPWIGMLVG